ncbi:MAG: SMP-30/gluconolactonase/LRE family protein [Verrucomicrobiaceae bacterium]|nr:SMP-30/gluconolactonase/LRE family protein [Verrucomicrobiaceae bacterium]
MKPPLADVRGAVWAKDRVLVLLNGKANANNHLELYKLYSDGSLKKWAEGIGGYPDKMAMTFDGRLYLSDEITLRCVKANGEVIDAAQETHVGISKLILSPDQTQLYTVSYSDGSIACRQLLADDRVGREQSRFYQLEGQRRVLGLCVDTNGWLYAATSLGIQVCDQAGRVNFIIPIPKPAGDLCFGGKDLSELFIACGDKIYKRPTKAKGVVSGQQAPIKPPPPKL